MIRLVAIALGLAAIFLLPPKVSSQDTVTGKPDKMISVKIKMDEDGKSFDIDTTFIIGEDFDEQAFQEAMREYHEQMKKVEQQMMELEGQFNEQDLKEVQEEIRRSVREAHRVLPEIRGHCRWIGEPDDLEMQYMPGSVHRMERMRVPHGIVGVRPGKKGETLSDILGDIPMSTVKSYRVKETKEGKRITIEVSDDAFMVPHDPDVFIWRNARPHPRPRPEIRREIYIDTQEDVAKPEKAEQPEKPESPVE